MIELRDPAIAEALAYVDDSLPPDRRRAFERRMEGDPEISSRIETWLAQNEAIRSAFGAESPRRIHPRAGGDLPRRTPNPERTAQIIKELRQNARMASSGAVVRPQQAPARVAESRRQGLARCFSRIGVTVLGALRRLRPRATHSAAPDLSACRTYAGDRRQAVELAISDSDALQQWFKLQLDRPIVVPALAGAGFALVGGRIVPGAEGLAAFALYRNAAGERVCLVIEAAS